MIKIELDITVPIFGLIRHKNKIGQLWLFHRVKDIINDTEQEKRFQIRYKDNRRFDKSLNQLRDKFSQ
jgi:hypothetical protein